MDATTNGKQSLFLDADGCAARYAISARTWRREVDKGNAPKPYFFGSLPRWSIATLAEWESKRNPNSGPEWN